MADQAADPRTEAPHICGITTTSPAGVEYVCLEAPHDPHSQRAGKPIPYGSGPARRGQAAKADRHWFVRRYPHRPHPVAVARGEA